jgi:hypothetical protein
MKGNRAPAMTSHYEKYTKPWRLANPEKRNAMKLKNYRARNFSPTIRRPWLDEELRAIHHSDLTDTVLAAELKRSVLAIQIKRSRTKGQW